LYDRYPDRILARLKAAAAVEKKFSFNLAFHQHFAACQRGAETDLQMLLARILFYGRANIMFARTFYGALFSKLGYIYLEYIH
jgi:hypothetical protein